MLGKVVLLAGAGAAYVLRSPQARARLSQLLGSGAGRTGQTAERERAPAQLPAGQGSGSAAAGSGEQRSRPRLMQVPRRRTTSSGETVPALVDRRPDGSDVEGVPDELTGAHLLPDATPVEIARSVSEQQQPPR